MERRERPAFLTLLVRLNDRLIGDLSIDERFVAAKDDSSRSNQPGRLGIDFVFNGLDASLQRFRGLIRINPQPPLQDAWSAIKFFSDEMNRAAVPLVAGIKDALMCIQSRIFWQQCRVDVEDPAPVVLNECRTQNAHETRENKQIGFEAVELRDDSTIERFTVSVIAVTNTRCRNAGGFSSLEAERIRIVAKNHAQVQVEAARSDGIDERLKVTA